ncbi:MAG: DUF4158 domain-containing protein [Streptosporangiales bacterium]|nr:DUF4158 domain-containing protein [Streptosporangiales bacterium]
MLSPAAIGRVWPRSRALGPRMMRAMEVPEGDVDELVEFWTLLDEDRALLTGKHGASALGFALLLKYYSRHGRFPRGRVDLPETAIGFVARQVDLADADPASYEWSGRTMEYHRAQIREHLGFSLATIADQGGWCARRCGPRSRPGRPGSPAGWAGRARIRS